MLSIQELKDQFEIQGGYCIKTWDNEKETSITLAEGMDFECEWYKINEKYLNAEIVYMYAVDGILNIELEFEKEG